MKATKIHTIWISLLIVGIQTVASAKATTSAPLESSTIVDNIIDVINENTKDSKDDESDIPDKSIDEIIVNAANSSKEFEFFYDEDKKMVKLEYDMIFTMDELKEKSRRKRTAGIKNGRQGGYRWTNNHIYYDYAYGTFNSYQKQNIQAALGDWARYTCLTFSYSTNHYNRVRFQNGGGCSSRVGMVGGVQPVTLAPNCRWRSVVTHEVGHAIGLNHEQTRPDRDRYVRIIYRNIPANVRFNFQRYTWYDIINLGIPYDYLSIMHYSGDAFSSNGGMTIQTLDRRYQNIIGRRHKLSFRDIKTVNLMYQCSKSCSLKDSQCPGEGFVGKDCKCWCPGTPYVHCSATTGGTKTKTGGTKKTIIKPTSKPTTDKTKVKKGCYDMHSKCDSWAKDNQCQVNPKYMLEYCKKSCKVCNGGGGDGKTGTKSCVDYDSRCGTWAAYCNGYYYKSYMTNNCPRTCGICKSKVTSTSTSCVDYNYYCSWWARSGYCKSAIHKYRSFMEVKCKKSCNKCTAKINTGGTSCVDLHILCSDWANRGECEANPRYMLRSCKKSCKKCGGTKAQGETSGGCADMNTQCSDWANRGECKANPKYMLVNCRRSCNVCGSHRAG